MKQRFKDRVLQQTYEDCLRQVAIPTSSFWWNGRPSRGDSLRSAFWGGYDGQPPRSLRTTMAYAAWAAGQDYERAGR